MNIYTVKAIVILDNDGKRIIAKYYDETFSSTKEQAAFETKLFSKTNKVILLDGLICLYRSNVDLFFYVIGDGGENELMLLHVLNCLYDSTSQILRKNVEKKALLDNLDVVILAIDEVCDSGVILETDASTICSRIVTKSDDLTFSEQSVAQVGMQVR
ncbi:unnamed protein product [Soboliphyme baturini]|uniref:Coatomer subunit zeta n=1 Tax=Soboliphyme baturini TaxID=241478 RepID=A0A3P8CJB8_9BILA|nr:unnamed protein product [Soboliphyme baturini]